MYERCHRKVHNEAVLDTIVDRSSCGHDENTTSLTRFLVLGREIRSCLQVMPNRLAWQKECWKSLLRHIYLMQMSEGFLLQFETGLFEYYMFHLSFEEVKCVAVTTSMISKGGHRSWQAWSVLENVEKKGLQTVSAVCYATRTCQINQESGMCVSRESYTCYRRPTTDLPPATLLFLKGLQAEVTTWTMTQ